MTLKGNIKKNYYFTFFQYLSLTDAIWMLFLAYRGMSLVEIGLLESVYHFTSMTMEIPTGLIADRYGRKTSRLVGRIIALVSTMLMLAAHDFWLFALAFVFTALGNNLESGAGDALIYDTLLETDQAPAYMKLKGQFEVCFQVARILSLVVGGWIATKSYELGYGLTLVVNLITIGIAMGFKEPNIHQSQEKPKDMWHHVKSSLKVVKSHKHIFNYIFFLEGFALFHTTLYFYFQNFLKSVGYTEAVIGLILALAAGSSIVLGASVYKIEGLIGKKNLIKVATLMTVIALGGMALTPFEWPFYILLSCLDGALFVAFSDYINRLIPSEHRATLLSFQSMVFSILMILLFPMFGWVASSFGFKWAFGVVFGVSLVFTPFTYYKLTQSFKREANHD